MLLFDGFFWTVPESAAALCSLSADWPTTWLPPPPAWFCVGRLRGPVQVAGRRIRGRDVRLRDRAVVAGAEDADRDVLVRCAFLLRQRGCIRLLSVVSGLADRLRASGRAPHGSGVTRVGVLPHPHALAGPAAWLWPAVCAVPFTFAAVAFDVASFDCEVEPSLPGLSTRTGVFVFDGFSWTVAESAVAS